MGRRHCGNCVRDPFARCIYVRDIPCKVVIFEERFRKRFRYVHLFACKPAVTNYISRRHSFTYFRSISTQVFLMYVYLFQSVAECSAASRHFCHAPPLVPFMYKKHKTVRFS